MPVPMSDSFLVLLVRQSGGPSFREVGIYMDLQESQISNIFSDSTMPDYEIKLFCVSS